MIFLVSFTLKASLTQFFFFSRRAGIPENDCWWERYRNWMEVHHSFTRSSNKWDWNSPINCPKSILNLIAIRWTSTSLHRCSVATVIEFLMLSKYPGLEGAEAIIHFIRVIDRLFDLLNSKNPFGKGYKRLLPVNNRNIHILPFNTERFKWNVLAKPSTQNLCLGVYNRCKKCQRFSIKAIGGYSQSISLCTHIQVITTSPWTPFFLHSWQKWLQQ